MTTFWNTILRLIHPTAYNLKVQISHCSWNVHLSTPSQSPLSSVVTASRRAVRSLVTFPPKRHDLIHVWIPEESSEIIWMNVSDPLKLRLPFSSSPDVWRGLSTSRFISRITPHLYTPEISSLGEVCCFREWTVWYYTPLRFFPSLTPDLSRLHSSTNLQPRFANPMSEFWKSTWRHGTFPYKPTFFVSVVECLHHSTRNKYHVM